MKPKVICTFNNLEVFDKVVKNNEFIGDAELFTFNNTNENIAITKNYNKFLDENVYKNPEVDYWCIFIHQDFGFMEELNSVVDKLEKSSIYGAVGVKIFKGLFFGKKGIDRKLGFKTELKLICGSILQGNNDFNFKSYGRKVYFQTVVDAVDCCCIILHSSLIKKYNLRFDENLSFHMYAEELCYSAKLNHKIETKVYQMNCYHLGRGCFNQEFDDSVRYLKDKFKLKRIPSICPN